MALSCDSALGGGGKLASYQPDVSSRALEMSQENSQYYLSPPPPPQSKTTILYTTLPGEGGWPCHVIGGDLGEVALSCDGGASSDVV